MLNNLIINIIIFNFSIITVILWIITLIESYTNKNTSHNVKQTIYECGFFSISKNVLPLSVNTIILAIFVVIYEVELILLIPISLNWFFLSILTTNTLFVVIYIIFLTLCLDFFLNKLNWVY